MYSQNNEEQFILDKFKNQASGVFMDIGAFDGRWASNSLALAERGWSGICIEGSPFSFSKLFNEHLDRPSVLLLNAIVTHKDHISLEERVVRFWESPNSAASTINKENYEKWKDRILTCGHGRFKEMFVPQITMQEVTEWASGHHNVIDFVSIDVEGGSTELAMKFDPDRFGTKLICVEHDGNYSQLAVHFAKWGFAPVANNAENLILSR